MAISTLALGLEGLGHRVESVRPTRLPLPLFLKRVAYNARLPLRLGCRDPDLAVGFDVDGFLLPAARPFPLVVQLKGIAADEARFERGLPRWHLRALAALEGRNARGADRVLIPSRYSARRAREAYDLDPDGVRVVPEALDPETRSALSGRDGDRGASGPPTVLSVAHQYPRKNTRTLLRAFPRVLETLPGARLRVVGGGPRVAELRLLVRKLDLEGRARILGPLPEPADLWDEFAGADCFCLPSLQEGFGIVFLEAMAAGLPIVAGRAGAVPEVVAHDEVGLLVDPTDADALAAALVRVLTDDGLAHRLASAGRERVDDYTPEASARRFLEAVDDLLPTG